MSWTFIAGKKNPCGGGCSTVPTRCRKNGGTIRDASKAWRLMATASRRRSRCCKPIGSIRLRNANSVSETPSALCDNLDVGYTIAAIDVTAGRVTLKIGKKTLDERCAGKFPHRGAILVYEYVNAAPIPEALTAVANGRLSGRLHAPVAALLERRPPAAPMQRPDESTIDAAIRIAQHMLEVAWSSKDRLAPAKPMRLRALSRRSLRAGRPSASHPIATKLS